MEIAEQIEQDYNQAFKNKEELCVLVLRGLKTALKNAEIAKSREKLTADEIIKILKSEVKKRTEAAALYEQGGDPVRAEKERNEIKIVEKYLPAQMDESQIRQNVKKIIGSIGAAQPSDAGKVMGLVMKAIGSQADGSLVNKIVKEELQG